MLLKIGFGKVTCPVLQKQSLAERITPVSGELHNPSDDLPSLQQALPLCAQS
jgi:hypothetical protein